METMFNISYAACFLCLVAAIVGLLGKKELARKACFGLNLFATMTLTAYMVMRWSAAGRPPFSNMFESLVLFAWTILIVYIVVQVKLKMPVLNVAAALLVFLTLAYATKNPSEIKPLIPALQSNWLTGHVFSCFLGYGGFAVSFLAAVSLLFMMRAGSKATEESIEAVEVVIEKTVAFGFLFLTIGIITGAVWANSAWGTYWSWDPKETWSLITWLIYAGFLHFRFVKGWSGKRAAWMAILGFASVLFTYFGVNYLPFLKGLHSYA